MVNSISTIPILSVFETKYGDSDIEYFMFQVPMKTHTVKKDSGYSKFTSQKVLVIKLFQIVEFDTSHLNKNVTFLVNHYYNIYLRNRP